MMRVTVIGATGQLGSDLVRVLGATEGYEVCPLGHSDIECTDSNSVEHVLTAVRPDVVVNCAAFVRVDESEDRPAEAFQVNALGALRVARACAKAEALCVYISTDYVFDGEKSDSYTEDNRPRPINVYGTSKLAGEFLVQQASPRWLIARVASLFGKTGARGKGGNFVEAVLAKARGREPLRVVSDIRISPTCTLDAARALTSLLRRGATGLFHLTNQGSCTWYEFACKIVELAGAQIRVEPTVTSEYPTRARRPANSALQSVRLDTAVREELRPWEDALAAYIF